MLVADSCLELVIGYTLVKEQQTSCRVQVSVIWYLRPSTFAIVVNVTLRGMVLNWKYIMEVNMPPFYCCACHIWLHFHFLVASVASASHSEHVLVDGATADHLKCYCTLSCLWQTACCLHRQMKSPLKKRQDETRQNKTEQDRTRQNNFPLAQGLLDF